MSKTPAIRLTAIEKHFGSVHANRGASLAVQAGEIHALVGENGAGKSTLMKILSGMIRPDSGTVEVRGRKVTGWTTAAAIAAGVGMVHQHFMLVPTLTVAENVVLGREPLRAGMFNRAAAVREVERLCKQSGLVVPPDRLVADLSVGEAQRVEILKLLYRGARVLLLDEPTAVLSPLEVADLWKVLARLRQRGATVVLITHKLDEVMAVSENVTVMRMGETVATMATRDSSPAAIAHAMVGRDVELGVRVAQPAAAVATALDVRNLVVRGARVERAVDDVSLKVGAGEILGIAGVEGNGQTELIEAIAGIRPLTSGTISLRGIDVTNRSVQARGVAGLSHIPEDRHRRGLILDYSVADNMILGQQRRYTKGGMLNRRAIVAHAREEIAQYDIRPPDPFLPARALSGGNQQKIVIARELARTFTVLLAAQPTRGVDVGAIEFIHAELRKARTAGKGVLLVSAELREILTLSDRVAVMYGGRIVAMMPRKEASEETLGPYMTGVR
ncbi:MAG TPA: ABC transporter ATP-binding protein [Gemmatimonadaceae bacterium]|jgi:simple sugar transport system ATP-binding protein